MDAIPDRTYRAALRQVIPTADRTKATITVKVRLLEKDENLGPEMSAKITFLKRAEQSSRALRPIIAVPRDTLVTRNGITAVSWWTAREKFISCHRQKQEKIPLFGGPNRENQFRIPWRF